ncbi:hypothetical protein Q5P01_017523 [Channa striata]|uniref:PH domain-containing protein n=1 Tax=Channa striata TaxID=64152 RepID=A0AA88M9G1_CHASR|nr:hypothetical protein Q5P01_017523 [Channa striata]
MSKKQSRWRENLVNSKSNTPAQKKGGKNLAASTAPACSGGKQAGSSSTKPSVICGRSNSLGSRTGDLTCGGSKVGGSLKRDGLTYQHSFGQQGARQASRPARSALSLCSSRSFSSLHTSSLAAVPFMRSSRSLSRLDQRPAGDDHPSSQPKGQTTEEKVVGSGQLSDDQHQSRGDNNAGEKMKAGASSESSSSLVSTYACNPRGTVTKQWQKHWFVLTDQMLSFYKDSVAEEASDVDGVINLSTCFDITDYPTQKNCGFQIHTKDGVYTLCAMTSGMKRNWVHAVLKNVRPGLTPELTGSSSEENPQHSSQKPDTESAEVLSRAENPISSLQEETGEWAEDSCEHQKEQESELRPEREQRSADGSSSASSAASPVNPPHQVEEDEAASCHQCPLLVAATTQTDASSFAEGAGSDNSAKTTSQTEEQQVPLNASCEGPKNNGTLLCEQQTVQLVRELEQTQKELSRLQQLNRNLQDELEEERELQASEKKDPYSNPSSSSEKALAIQRLQKINRDLRTELEAQRRSQDEAREAELRRRVDLLAQQAQLLVTGDATALAQAHLEQDRRRIHEQQVDWEQCMASLKSQLSISEEQRREAESRLTQLQQELQGYHNLQQEAERLQEHLQELTTQLRANEDAQAQKEARLQKHLMLLQASQDRERRSLTASMAKAEQHSQELQERLDRAEQQVESLNKTQSLTREIEEAQQQLQEELTRTVSAVQKLQEEREQLDRRCQQLQNQLQEADGEVSRLQGRLKTEETHYYNLEHSHERVCEELQLALGKVEQRESETQEIREGYEKLLDRKEQELTEVLLKMEVLGNSLEETEVKLNEVMKACTCASPQPKDESEPHDRRPVAPDSDQPSNNSNAITVQMDGSREHARGRSRSIDPSYQFIVPAGDDTERFVSVIQFLETKLYVTEEKLRDITQRLEEHQSHVSCQDPHLCSQLTQCRATAQHLSLLLHSRAKQSQRFAQETESCCRTLAGRFQVALNVVQACRERLQGSPVNATGLEKQLATVAACLQQGGKDAEKLQHESYNSSRGESKILNGETLAGTVGNCALTNTLSSGDEPESVGMCLMRELFVVEKMVSVLQSQQGQLSLISRPDQGDAAHRYKSIMSQRLALKTERRTQSGWAGCDNGENVESAINRVCAEAELIYAAIKLLKKHETQRKSLADISPPELAPYEEQVQDEDRSTEEAAQSAEKEPCDDKKVEEEKEPDWLEKLVAQLQRRAIFLHQLCQDVSECSTDHDGENGFAEDLNWMREQAKLIYLSERLYLDSEQESQQSEELQKKVETLEKEKDMALLNEQEAFTSTVRQLQQDNGKLRQELERAEQEIMSAETGNQRLLEDMQKIEDFHEERMQKLETEFQEKIKELQQIHEEEMKHLHGFYTKSCERERQKKSCPDGHPETTSSTSTPEETAMERQTKEELGNQMAASGAAAEKESHQKAPEKPQTPSGEGFTATEEMHRKLIDLQQQHQMEVAALVKEKDQLLQEETAATMAAIVAMRRAHKQELERCRQTQHIRENADITQLHAEYEKEIQLLHKELESLSLQHTQKCLENSKLSQDLQGERKVLMQYQQENQELKKKQIQADEMSQLHCSLNAEQSHVAPHINDFYEMEVILRAREAEMQFLRQEARSLREELKIARMDKIYAQNKLQYLYRNSQEELRHDVVTPGEDFKFATWSPSRDASGQHFKDTATNTSNGAFQKKAEKSSLMCRIRGVRSKSLKEGLSIQERMKLFESF